MEFILTNEKQEADRKRIEAKGIADFQTIVAAGISEQLLRWKGIEATEKLASSPNTICVMDAQAPPGGTACCDDVRHLWVVRTVDIHEMISCNRTFYSGARILQRVCSNVSQRRAPLISMVSNLSYRSNIRVACSACADFKRRFGNQNDY